MSEKYCPNCEDYREFTVIDRTETYNVRGREISVRVQVEMCTRCEQALFDESRDEGLLRTVYAEYRKQQGLLRPEEIKALRERYCLSQKSLAGLLGMSEATINRYERGGLQNQAHDTAIRACQNPQVIRDLLRRRGNVLSDWQRKKVESALVSQGIQETDPLAAVNLSEWTAMPDQVSHLTGFRRFGYNRYAALIVWFCKKLRRIAPTKLYKLLFYADFLNFKVTSVSLSGAAYRKIQYGPVPADYGRLRDRLERDDYVEVNPVFYPDGISGEEYRPGPNADKVPRDFTEPEQEVLDYVANTFRTVTASEISDRSHRESAWLNTEDKQLISYAEAMNLSLSLPD